MILLTFIVFILDTLYFFWTTHVPEIFDPLILLMIITLFISLYLIRRNPKHLGLVILLMAVNIVVLIVVNNHLGKSLVVFDLIIKVCLFILLGQASLIAYKKEV